MKFREESDSMGTVHVPSEAYYGSQTQRAVENFKISGLAFPSVFINSIVLIKKSAAIANYKIGVLEKSKMEAIVKTTEQILHGQFTDQFPVDVFQTGSGTSTNMNVNEVIASRANEILTGEKGGREPVHPNDHVNNGQSSNDVIPTAIHVTVASLINTELLPSMTKLLNHLKEKAREYKGISKIGRTHLQDAVPMTLGQEFSGYARQVELGIPRIQVTLPRLAELAIGGTAIGTGVNTHPNFAPHVIQNISKEMDFQFIETSNHFEAQASRDTIVELSGALKTYAVSLSKIANDLRWLSSGPRCGLSEIILPALQPGSSIMPGKVNPVIPEMVMQVAAQVIGNDTAITFAGQSGSFELNVMMPVIAHNIIQSIQLLSTASTHLAEKCIKGIKVNTEKISSYVERSLAMATLLVPEIGYDEAARIAKKAAASGRSVREISLEEGIHFPDKKE